MEIIDSIPVTITIISSSLFNDSTTLNYNVIYSQNDSMMSIATETKTVYAFGLYSGHFVTEACSAKFLKYNTNQELIVQILP